ncbi:MAG: homoserine dehydrogenase, partial [Patescibacteria group bacterium]
MNKPKPFFVAVLGQGNVGSEVIRSLQNDEVHLEERAGKPLKLAAIHRRVPENGGDVFQKNPQLYRSLEEIFADPEIDLVCELMGGIDAARQAIERALDAGKHVVSANKDLFAAHWPEILQKAKERNVQIRLEAAVAGGVPILHALSSGTSSEQPYELCGIINGTTNFILTQMEERRASYEDCLALAQRKGYAEIDPSSDVLGRDACRKLSLLIAYAFGKHIPPDQIPTRGITGVSSQDIEHAKSMNPSMAIKLVARAEQVNSDIIARVGPELVLATSPIGQVPANLNAVQVKSNLNRQGNFYQGEGAGGKPTASAVLSDIIH